MKKTSVRPFSRGASAWLVAALFLACQSATPRSTDDLGRLQGYWEGRCPGGECAVTISGDSLLYTQPATDIAKASFWFETTFTLPADTDPKQLHATITNNNSPGQPHIGTVVVTIFKIEGEALTLGVVEDFEGPLPDSIVGDWDRVIDLYHFERGSASNEPRG